MICILSLIHCRCIKVNNKRTLANVIGNLKLELLRYLAKADGIVEDLNAVQWWKTKMVLLLEPSSAASE